MSEKPKIGSLSKSELSDHLSVVPKYEAFEVCNSTTNAEIQTLHSCDLSMSLSDETQTEVLLHVKGSFNGNHYKEVVNMNRYCIEEMEQNGRVVKAKACIFKHAGAGVEKW